MNENIKIVIRGLIEEKKVYAKDLSKTTTTYMREALLKRILEIDVEIKNLLESFEVETKEKLVEKIKTIIKDQDEKYIVYKDFEGDPIQKEFLFEPSDLKNNILEDIENLIEKKNEK